MNEQTGGDLCFLYKFKSKRNFLNALSGGIFGKPFEDETQEIIENNIKNHIREMDETLIVINNCDFCSMSVKKYKKYYGNIKKIIQNYNGEKRDKNIIEQCLRDSFCFSKDNCLIFDRIYIHPSCFTRKKRKLRNIINNLLLTLKIDEKLLEKKFQTKEQIINIISNVSKSNLYELLYKTTDEIILRIWNSYIDNVNFRIDGITLFHEYWNQLTEEDLGIVTDEGLLRVEYPNFEIRFDFDPKDLNLLKEKIPFLKDFFLKLNNPVFDLAKKFGETLEFCDVAEYEKHAGIIIWSINKKTSGVVPSDSIRGVKIETSFKCPLVILLPSNMLDDVYNDGIGQIHGKLFRYVFKCEPPETLNATAFGINPDKDRNGLFSFRSMSMNGGKNCGKKYKTPQKRLVSMIERIIVLQATYCVINNKTKQDINRDKWERNQPIDELVSCSFEDLDIDLANGKKIYPEYLVSIPALQLGDLYDKEFSSYNRHKTGNYLLS